MPKNAVIFLGLL